MKQQSTIQLFGKPQETYYLLGLLGVFVSIVFLGILSLDGKYALIDLVINFLTAITIVYVFNVVKAFITDKVEYTYYHYYLLILASIIVINWWINNPVLQYLDVAVICLSIIGAVGRIGCYHSGCCHGKLIDRGDGNEPLFFPVQLIESGLHTINAIIGICLIIRSVEFGLITQLLVGNYAIGRFLLEFKRGDKRPFLWGYSEAQWTSFFLILILITYNIFL